MQEDSTAIQETPITNEAALEASKRLLNETKLITLFSRTSLSTALSRIVDGHKTLAEGKAIQFGDYLVVFEKPHTYPDDPKIKMKKDRCFQIGKGKNSVTLTTGITNNGAMTGMYLTVNGEEYHVEKDVATGNFNYINLDPMTTGKDNLQKVEAPTLPTDKDNNVGKGDPVEVANLLSENKVGKSYQTRTAMFERPQSLGPQTYETPESLSQRFPEQLIGFAQAIGEISPTNSVDRVNAGYFDFKALSQDLAKFANAKNAQVVGAPKT